MKWLFGMALAAFISSGTAFAGDYGEDGPYNQGRWLGYANAGSGPGYYPPSATAVRYNYSPYSRQAPPPYYWNHWDRHDWRQSLEKERGYGFEQPGGEPQAHEGYTMKKWRKRYRSN